MKERKRKKEREQNSLILNKQHKCSDEQCHNVLWRNIIIFYFCLCIYLFYDCFHKSIASGNKDIFYHRV